jgi:hypothetical protein
MEEGLAAGKGSQCQADGQQNRMENHGSGDTCGTPRPCPAFVGVSKGGSATADTGVPRCEGVA